MGKYRYRFQVVLTTFEMVVAINHAKPTAAQRVMGMSAPYRAERVIFLEAGE